MPQGKVYLDADGNPIGAATGRYLDDSGNPVADFATTNQKDAHGNAVVEPNTVGTFVRHVGRQINPIPAIGMMGQAAMDAGSAFAALGQGRIGDAAEAGKRILQPLLTAQNAVKAKGDQAWQRGDPVSAVRHYVDWLVPVVGPILDQAADEMQRGEIAAGLGDTLGFSLSTMIAPQAVPAVLEKIKAKLPSFKNPNAVEREAVRFGQEQGIPVDAGTASGNRFVKAVQAGADQTPVGSLIAERSKATTSEALERVGGNLASRVHPSATTPELAGSALKRSTEDLIRTLDDQAATAYNRLREIEANPAHARLVPNTPSRSESQVLARQMAESLGSHAPTAAELAELRRIRAEMDALPFVKRTFNEASVGHGGDVEVVGGAAGAPVYDDILAAYSGGSAPPRKSVIIALDQALFGGRFNNLSKAALEVARKRLAGESGLSKPSLPPEAGTVAATTRPMLLPVDLRPAKTALQPIYDAMKREAELVPLMGDRGRALVALDRLLNGPDFQQVSVVDSALSDLKAMARGAAMPELRTKGQGTAAAAVGALEQQVQSAVRRAGPDAVKALEQGRGAVKTKALVADVLDAIRQEPVQAYRQATAPKDTGIGHLKQLEQVAPEVLPQVGRAWLEDGLQAATAEGTFEKGAKLYADWQRLGPETKRLLFGQTAPDIERFLLLAKKLGESPNPSRTALASTSIGSLSLGLYSPTLMILSNLGAGGLSAILHNPKSAAWLTRGMAKAVGHGRASATLQAAAVADVLRAAKEAGVPVALPAAASEEPSSQTPTAAGSR